MNAEEQCSGCKGGTVHHTCGKLPAARLKPITPSERETARQFYSEHLNDICPRLVDEVERLEDELAQQDWELCRLRQLVAESRG